MLELSPLIWAVAVAVALTAGFVKGVVGFAMPMIMISGLATVLAPDLALGILMVPTAVANIWQALRGGVAAAVASARTHWRFLAILWGFIVFSAQLIYVLPEAAMFLILGVPVTIFAGLQLIGWRLQFPASARRRVEILVASIAGFIGGLSGVWGPPTVMYLTSLDTEKREQVRVQGIVYGSGAVVLLVSHLQSGVFNATVAPVSTLMLIPALLGMTLGFRVQDRINQARFRQLTLIVLIVAGLNLVRRGLMG